MTEMNVRIVELEPLHVAAAYGFSSNPEGIAWDKLTEYMKSKGMDKDNEQRRFFGFNNPSPAPGSPNYGYEFWVTVTPQTEAGGDIKIKDFGGGLYAVTRCKLRNIVEAWQAFVGWHEKSAYRHANHQWLEEVINPPLDAEITEDVDIDLYMPIAR